jgi:hypothetical protein
MSFKSVLADIGHVVGIGATAAQAVAPIVTALDPPVGAILSAASSFIIGAETAFPAATTGPTKKAAVMDQLSAALPLLQVGLQAAGIKFTVTPELETALSNSVDEIVGLFNNLAVFKAAIG